MRSRLRTTRPARSRRRGSRCCSPSCTRGVRRTRPRSSAGSGARLRGRDSRTTCSDSSACLIFVARGPFLRAPPPPLAGLSRRSRTAYEAVGDAAGVAGAINNLGILRWQRDDVDGALADYADALRLSEELGDYRTGALLYNNTAEGRRG